MTPEARSRVFRYGVAVDLVILATGIGLLFPAGPVLILSLFVAAVALSAWKGGWRGAATAIGTGFVFLLLFFPDLFGVSLLLTFLAMGAAAALIVRVAVSDPDALATLRQTAGREGTERHSDDRAAIDAEFKERLDREVSALRQKAEEKFAHRIAKETAAIDAEMEARYAGEIEAVRKAADRRLSEQLEAEQREAQRAFDERVAVERRILEQQLEENLARERQLAREQMLAREREELQRRNEEALDQAGEQEERAAEETLQRQLAELRREIQQKTEQRLAEARAALEREAAERVATPTAPSPQRPVPSAPTVASAPGLFTKITSLLHRPPTGTLNVTKKKTAPKPIV